MQRIAVAWPWAEACLHANPPGARRARAKPRAATRFRGRAQRPAPHGILPILLILSKNLPRTLCVSAALLSLR